MNYYLPNHHRSNSGATYFNYNDNIQVSSNKYTYNNRYTNIYKSSLYNQSPVKKNYVSEDSYDTPSNSNSDSDQEDNISLSLKDKVFSPGDNDDNYYNENDIHNSSILMSNNVSSDLSMSQSIIYNSNPMPKNKTKKTLILDLDETLVHSSFKPFYSKPDIHLRIQFKNEYHNVYALKRPYVDNFLYQMSKLFDIIIFTASIPEYANPLLDKLDKSRVIKGRLFRENCTITNGLYVKDLNILGKNLKDVIIVDNNPISYSVNKENGIPIKTWHYDKGDYELEKLVPFLTYLSGVEDVRRIIKRVISRNEVNFRYVDDILSRVNLNNIENDQSDSYYIDDTKLAPRSQSMKNCSYINQNRKMSNYNTISINPNRNKNISIHSPNHNCSRQKESNDNENRSLLHSMKVNKLKEEIINQINTTNPKINSSHTIEYLNYNKYNPSLYQNNQDTIFVKSISSYNIKTPTSHSNNTLKTIDTSSLSPTNAHYKTSYTFSPNRQLPRASSSYCVHKNYNNSSLMNTINTKLNNNYFQKSFADPQISGEESKQNHLFKSTNIYPPKNYSTSSNPLYKTVNINKISKNSSTIGTNNSNSSIFSKETNYYIKRKMMCRQQSVNNYSKKKCFFNTSAFSNLSNVSFYGNTNNIGYLSGEKNISMYSSNNNGNTTNQSSRYLYNDRRFVLK